MLNTSTFACRYFPSVKWKFLATDILSTPKPGNDIPSASGHGRVADCRVLRSRSRSAPVKAGATSCYARRHKAGIAGAGGWAAVRKARQSAGKFTDGEHVGANEPTAERIRNNAVPGGVTVPVRVYAGLKSDGLSCLSKEYGPDLESVDQCLHPATVRLEIRNLIGPRKC